MKVTHGLSKVPETTVTRKNVLQLKMKRMSSLEYDVLEVFDFCRSSINIINGITTQII